MPGAGHLVVAVAVRRRVAVRPPRGDADQVVRLGHDVDDRHADVAELPARVAVRRRGLALVDRDRADEARRRRRRRCSRRRSAGRRRGHERVDGVDVVVEVAAGLRVAEAVDVLDRARRAACRRSAGWTRSPLRSSAPTWL